MQNHIGQHLAMEVALPLAAEFGDRLENMTKNAKLLLINILSGGLHELETCPVMDRYSFVDYCHDQRILRAIPDDLIEDVLHLLKRFDKYDSKVIEMILIVLVLSLQ